MEKYITLFSSFKVIISIEHLHDSKYLNIFIRTCLPWCVEEELVTAFFLLDGIAMMLLFLTRTFTLPYCTMIVPSSPGDSTTVANLPPNPFTWTCSPICGVYKARSASLMGKLSAGVWAFTMEAIADSDSLIRELSWYQKFWVASQISVSQFPSEILHALARVEPVVFPLP